MTLRPRPGLTVLELCVALMLVGVLSSIAAVQFARRASTAPAVESLQLTLRAARVSALRSGRAVTGATLKDGEWVEYTALPTGILLIDSTATGVTPTRSQSRGDSVDTH